MRALFAEGWGLADETTIGIRSGLRGAGFTMDLALNKKGYLFKNAAGEDVRIMNSSKGWHLRVMNAGGNYLDALGNPGTTAASHLPISNR